MGRRLVTVPLRRLAAACVAACALILMLTGPAAAAPAQQAPCWQKLMLDYYDGTIDKRYAIPCYQEALRNLGDDERYYSTAEDDIRAALRRAIANENGQGGGGDGGTTTAPDLSAAADGDDDSVPVPLLALGGVALVLVAVGAAGIVRKRMRDDGSGTS